MSHVGDVPHVWQHNRGLFDLNCENANMLLLYMHGNAAGGAMPRPYNVCEI